MEAEASVRLQKAAANLLSEIKHACRTSQKAIDNLVKGTDQLVNIYLEVLKYQFHKKLLCFNGYITLERVNGILDSFQDQSVFEGLQTHPQVQSFLRETSGGEKVLLKQAVVKTKFVQRNGVPREIPFKFGYMVPFLAQLEQMLNCPGILHFIDNPMLPQKGVYRTVTDGLFYKYHPIVLKNGPQTIAIQMHIDDAEPCDALKSHAGHNNLRLAYWTIGNIYPEQRSSLKAINLLAISKAKVAKQYGNDFLFEDFISGLKKLAEGVVLNVMGAPRKFFGILLFGSFDNPAAANIGGFKETHSALRPCRNCMIKSEDMNKNIRESIPLLRKLDDHRQQVRQVVALNQQKIKPARIVNIYSSQQGEEDMEMSPDVNNETENIKASMIFGVNGPSILSEAPYFDVCKCLTQDIMHILNEGIVENVCRFLLKDLCLPAKPRAKPALRLEELNYIIESVCDLGHLSASRPSPIDKSHITGSKLKQSASQMLVLMRILPFVIRNRCSDAKQQLLLKLNRLVDDCMLFAFKDEEIDKLGDSIEEFGALFLQLYPDYKGLKLHSLSHLPTQIRLFGPLRQHWNFRNEAMHSNFTNIFAVVRSMKNPAFTAAVRHLDAKNHAIKQAIESGNYLNCDSVITGAEDVLVSSLIEKEDFLAKFHTLQNSTTICKVNEFSLNGSKWHAGVIFLKDRESNTFCRICNVYKWKDTIIFSYNILKTKFDPGYNAFEILSCGKENYVISFSELAYKFPILRFSFAFRNKTTLNAYLMPQTPVSCY